MEGCGISHGAQTMAWQLRQAFLTKCWLIPWFSLWQ